MAEVPRVVTPITAEDAAKLVVEGLERTLGEVPYRDTAELVMAQVWIETGRGQKMQNNNPGNLSSSAEPDSGDFWRPTWFELTAESSARDRYLHKQMLKGEAPHAFRSYAYAEDGFADYFALLAKPRFAGLLDAARGGSSGAFAQAVYDSGYTKDLQPSESAKSFASLMQEFEQKGLFDSLPKGGGWDSPRSASLGSPGSSFGALSASRATGGADRSHHG